VSLATNHALDYSYGGLNSTWAALDAKGIVHAGTGRNLGEARAPAYLDTRRARVALVSMTSTFTNWSKAGATRSDLKGRPGVNPLGHHHTVDRSTLDVVIELATKFGWWVTQVDDHDWLLNRAGLHNTLVRVTESSVPGVGTEVDEVDAEENLHAIREARKRSDFVIVHVHNHEWDPEFGLTSPAKFLPPFARRCVDAGADVFVAQGSHAPLRGVEIYNHRAIFYDPGDLFLMSDMVTRFPDDFYQRHARTITSSAYSALPSEALEARSKPTYSAPRSPSGGYQGDRLRCGFVPLLDYDEDLKLKAVTLHPFSWGKGPIAYGGIPMLADPHVGAQIVDYVRDLSKPFGTRIEYDGTKGHVVLEENA
jgi:poly-gamma-glutamate synthesis protein (capsule biosynthesis protein)